MANNQKQPTNQTFDDREIMNDILTSQKFITETYNTCANECSSAAIKTELMNILNEEHQIQHEIFDEMSKRGWYQTDNAPQNKVDAVKQKYSPQAGQ